MITGSRSSSPLSSDFASGVVSGFGVGFWCRLCVIIRHFWRRCRPVPPLRRLTFVLCMDRTHGGQVYGDMVDTLSPAIRVVEIDGSQLVATEVDVEVIRSLLARTQGHDMSS